MAGDVSTIPTLHIDQWIAEAQRGSGEALGRLLQACRDYLLVIAHDELRHDLRAKAGASDLVQETFLDAQRGFGRFRGQTEAELLAWLRQILVCHLVNLRRQYCVAAKRNVRRELPLAHDGADSTSGRSMPPATSLTPSWHAVKREEVELVELAVERLPDDYRQIIRLVNREHQSFAEAATAMHRSADAARRLWGRAIEKLAAALEAHHERP